MKPRAGVLDIEPYMGGASTVPGVERIIKLSSNESALGPSPRAVAAYREAAGALHRYPEGSAEILRDAIGARYGLDPARIICGAGSDEIISLLCQAYLAPGDESLYSAHGFAMYPISTRAAGGTPVAAPEKDLTASVDALLAAVSERTRIVFIANPNNPTGTYLTSQELRRLQAGLPPDVLLVVDAAYAEFVRRNDYEAGIELVATSSNVVMTRTFSKIHGLAALRIGWAYCPPSVVDVFHRIRGPFNVSIPAQLAGVAAIQDTTFEEAAARHNERWHRWLSEEIARLGLRVEPGAANFVLVFFRDPDTALAADSFLMRHGIIVRRVAGYGLPDALRITVGTEEENRAVVAALKDFQAGKAT